MIKAVVFDMFETLVSLFEGRTYFGENIAEDVGMEPAIYGTVQSLCWFGGGCRLAQRASMTKDARFYPGSGRLEA